MLTRLKNKYRDDFLNFRGWSTSKKIVVIESDDWGSLRTSSKKAIDALMKIGLPLDKDPYSMFDSLETNADLENLFEVLGSFKDIRNRPACFTANTIVGNPDFEKIRKSGFNEYYFEPFSETLKGNPGSDNVLDLYKEGMAGGVFRPQFHGREHLNFQNWISALKEGDKFSHEAFKFNMFSVYQSKNAKCREQFLDAFAPHSPENFAPIEESISEGCQLFESIFGYKAVSVVSPCLIWPAQLEKVFANNGLMSIQSGPKQNVPNFNSNSYNSKRHFIGERNSLGQVYTVRNIIFEPSIPSYSSDISFLLKSIEKAFYWKKPAIISSHRLNYIGSLDIGNRERNLKLLRKLLQSIQNRWPDIEFMSSDQLCMEIFRNSKNKTQGLYQG